LPEYYYGEIQMAAADINKDGLIDYVDGTFLEYKIGATFDPSIIPAYPDGNWLTYSIELHNLSHDTLDLILECIAMGDLNSSSTAYTFLTSAPIPFASAKANQHSNFIVEGNGYVTHNDNSFILPLKYSHSYKSLIGSQLTFKYPSDKFRLVSFTVIDDENIRTNVPINIPLTDALESKSRSNYKLHDVNGRVTFMNIPEPFTYFDISNKNAFVELEFQKLDDNVNVEKDFTIEGIYSGVGFEGFVAIDNVEIQMPKLVNPLSVISTNEKYNNVLIYPNPVNDFLKIDIENKTAQNISIVVYNMLGQRVKEVENITLNKGFNQFVLNFDAFVNGVYFIDIIMDTEQKQFKIIKK